MLSPFPTGVDCVTVIVLPNGGGVRYWRSGECDDVLTRRSGDGDRLKWKILMFS